MTFAENPQEAAYAAPSLRPIRMDEGEGLDSRRDVANTSAQVSVKFRLWCQRRGVRHDWKFNDAISQNGRWTP